MVDNPGRVKGKICGRCKQPMRECTVGARSCTSHGWIHEGTLSHYCEGHSMEANRWVDWQIKPAMTTHQYRTWRKERKEEGLPV